MISQNQQGSTPLVSILIPCYNSELWIRKCIESALSQTYSPKEIIVADDGSTDSSVSIIESFGPIIRLERLSHSGANVARNKLLELANGEWLQYLDADDYLLPDKISRQMAAVSPQTDCVDVVYSPVKVRWESQGSESVVDIDPTADTELNFIRWGPLSTISVLFRRSAIVGVGGWKDDQPCCQEHELFLRLISSGRCFKFLAHVGSVYRKHGAETISRRHPDRVIQTRMALTDSVEAHLDKSGRKTRRHKVALYIARLEAARSLYQLNGGLARAFYDRAVRHGRHLVWSSSALPLSYQLAMAIGSLDGAENLAKWWRRCRGIER